MIASASAAVAMLGSAAAHSRNLGKMRVSVVDHARNSRRARSGSCAIRARYIVLNHRTLCDFLPENPSLSASGNNVGGCQKRSPISSSSAEMRSSDPRMIWEICASAPGGHFTS